MGLLLINEPMGTQHSKGVRHWGLLTGPVAVKISAASKKVLLVKSNYRHCMSIIILINEPMGTQHSKDVRHWGLLTGPVAVKFSAASEKVLLVKSNYRHCMSIITFN